ncbi:MAG TPA: trans-aconitate 2-methyltransferase [Roseiarcus sp.]|nr:trans-aconitate 2-methyltransferase [Roseiarcus sp.]
MSDWDARQYLRFESERTRPAIDLLARVSGSARIVTDLGCGPGNSTELLVARFPGAEIVGLDSSDDMLAKARRRAPRVLFEKGDVATWRATTPPDVIFANAVMQWVPDHVAVMARLVDELAPGGRLAVQTPDNLDEPTHVLMRETASLPRFARKLAEAAAARSPIATFEDYYAALASRCARVDLWRTTYAHILEGPQAIVEWVKGTGLRPFLDPLSASEKEDYLSAYGAAVAKAYPRLPDGRVLLRFPRLFVVAVRAGGDEN